MHVRRVHFGMLVPAQGDAPPSPAAVGLSHFETCQCRWLCQQGIRSFEVGNTKNLDLVSVGGNLVPSSNSENLAEAIIKTSTDDPARFLPLRFHPCCKRRTLSTVGFMSHRLYSPILARVLPLLRPSSQPTRSTLVTYGSCRVVYVWLPLITSNFLRSVHQVREPQLVSNHWP